jgi:predicted DNA-binding protein (MmcQ/YjbR family)
MHLDEIHARCLAFPEVTEDFPFGPDPLVFKVGGKMFALLGIDDIPPRVVLKCDPERTVELRERYAGISTGPYFRNLHWNYVTLDGSVPGDLVRGMIDDSYRLVVARLKKADRERLLAAIGNG